VLATYINYI